MHILLACAIIIFVILTIKNLANENSLITLINLMIQLINMKDLMIGAISGHHFRTFSQF